LRLVVKIEAYNVLALTISFLIGDPDHLAREVITPGRSQQFLFMLQRPLFSFASKCNTWTLWDVGA
jgi:hypothetical protein